MSDVYKIAAYVPMSAELYEDVDRWNRPWAYPDPRVLPAFDLFPRWAKLVERYRETRRRITNARMALHGQGIEQEDDQW